MAMARIDTGPAQEPTTGAVTGLFPLNSWAVQRWAVSGPLCAAGIRAPLDHDGHTSFRTVWVRVPLPQLARPGCLSSESPAGAESNGSTRGGTVVVWLYPQKSPSELVTMGPPPAFWHRTMTTQQFWMGFPSCMYTVCDSLVSAPSLGWPRDKPLPVHMQPF